LQQHEEEETRKGEEAKKEEEEEEVEQEMGRRKAGVYATVCSLKSSCACVCVRFVEKVF